MAQGTVSPNTDADSRHEVKCPYCQRRFHTPDELTLHIVTRHTQSNLMRETTRAVSK